eukprot:sb/3478586/
MLTCSVRLKIDNLQMSMHLGSTLANLYHISSNTPLHQIQSLKWVRLWDWEVSQETWSSTSDVLIQAGKEVRSRHGSGTKVMLVCGIDMVEKMTNPGKS